MVDDKTGLRSEQLRTALEDALAGRRERLADLLARHGGLPGPRPNVALASALGDVLRDEPPARARPLIAALRSEAAPPESPRSFLPIAAAYAAVARIERDGAHAWDEIFELAADDRPAVRVGTIAALEAWIGRAPAHVDTLIARASRWIEHEDRDHRFAACGLVLDVIASRRGLEGVRDRAALLAWTERVIAEIAEAPRASERSPARRRILAALPAALVEIAASLRGNDDGIGWLSARLAEATHPDVRVAMDATIDGLRRGARAQPSVIVESLRAALAGSAKPPRDPSRIRKGMSGRGKKGDGRSR